MAQQEDNMECEGTNRDALLAADRHLVAQEPVFVARASARWIAFDRGVPATDNRRRKRASRGQLSRRRQSRLQSCIAGSHGHHRGALRQGEVVVSRWHKFHYAKTKGKDSD